MILFEKQHDVVRITLNRPDVHNAFNEDMIAELTKAFDDINDDESIKVVILSSSGKSFSAGADLNWMKKAASYDYEENLIDAGKLSAMLNALYHLKPLTIACVKGAAMGGGLGLISCVDIVIADRNSKFSFSEVKLGLIPATISPFVINAIGPRQAKRYFQTGEMLVAEKAKEIGLVHELSISEEGQQEILEDLLQAIKNNAPQAMRNSKKLIHDYAGETITDELRHQTAIDIAKARTSEEAKEGLSAFFEKRKADWKKDV